MAAKKVDERVSDVSSQRMTLLDENGAEITAGIPSKLTASFCRKVHVRGNHIDEVELAVNGGGIGRPGLIRAQLPHMVSLLTYGSKFQMEPVRREYFVYAPPDIKSSVKLAMKLWRRWEKPRRPEDYLIIDMNEDYPKVEDAAVSEVIDDKFFDEMWAYIRNRTHKAAGNPLDPFAFTSLDPDVMVYKHTDFQAGLAYKI